MDANSITYIGFVQDHSGSMFIKKELAKNNFNEQIAKLKKEDDKSMDNLVTVVEFDDDIYCNIDNVPVNEIKDLKQWWVGGMTALYDAIAFCINNIKSKMDKDKRKDKAALIVVQTDGQENQSSDYNGEEGRKKIKKLIDDLEETKMWTFSFLGENIEKEVAMDMGFKFGNIMSHTSNKDDLKAAYGATTDGLDKYMSSRKRGFTQVTDFYDGDNDNIKK